MENHIFQIFQIIFKLSSWNGISFITPSDKCNIYWLNIWDSLNIILHVVAYVLSIIGTHLTNFPEKTVYLLYAFCTLGLLTRFSLTTKKIEIFIASRKISVLGNNLTANAKNHLKGIRIQTYVYIAWMFCLLVNVSYIIITVGTNDLKYLWIIGIQVEMQNYSFMINFIRICLIYSLTVTAALICLALMFCCNIYIIANNMVKSFGQCLMKCSSSNNFSKKSLLSYISMYENLMNAFKIMDDGISNTCLLLYAASVISLFGSISLLLSEYLEDGSIVSISQNASNIFTSILIFFCLTHTGSLVRSQYINLKMILIRKIKSVFTITDDTQILLTYKLLIDTVNSLSIYFTVADMFSISKDLTLTTMGAMLTYGMIIFQGPR